MSWFVEEEKVTNMKELKRTLMDTLDTLEEELEQISDEIQSKKDEVDIAENELKGITASKQVEIDAIVSEVHDLQFEKTRKLGEISRVEQSIRLISGKRIRE
jgi:predicted  nucleic acid-binding Zn-ribbon protein